MKASKYYLRSLSIDKKDLTEWSDQSKSFGFGYLP